MANHLLKAKSGQLRAAAYFDYENIRELLKKSGQDRPVMDLFKAIQRKLPSAGLEVIDFTIYGDFEKDTFRGRGPGFHIPKLSRATGLQARNSFNKGKDCSDLELTVDVIKNLYKNPNIDVFIIISSGREITPLLRAIKYENKFSYVISTKSGPNPLVSQYADCHEYLEDILNLPPLSPAAVEPPDESFINVDPAAVSLDDIRRAQEVAGFLYSSHIWRKASVSGEPVNLKGYLDVVAGVSHRSAEELLDDFKLAHCMKYVTIYRDRKRGLCVKEGAKMDKFTSDKN